MNAQALGYDRDMPEFEGWELISMDAKLKVGDALVDLRPEGQGDSQMAKPGTRSSLYYPDQVRLAGMTMKQQYSESIMKTYGLYRKSEKIKIAMNAHHSTPLPLP